MPGRETSEQDTPQPRVVQRADTTLGQPVSNGGVARRRITKAINTLTDVLEKKNTYAYKDLNYDQEIRVLKLYPGVAGTPLLGCLITYPLFAEELNEASSLSLGYTALSYCWGMDEPENVVRIFDTDEAYEQWKKKDKTGMLLPFVGQLLVRDNLREALEQLRSESDAIFVWVDALCIYQGNFTERTAQVARMHIVYAQAEKVCIWLGKGIALNNRRAFEFLNKILDLQELEQLVERLEQKSQDGIWEEDRRDCKSTIDLMKADWFSRRWVIQELALANNPYVRRGDFEMPWLDFADAIALFMTKYDMIRRLCFGGPSDYYTARSSDEHHISSLDARALGANALVTTTANLFRKSNDGKIVQRLLSLELLVSSMLLAFEASDPKDTIFAVLQIAKDTPGDIQKTRLDKRSTRIPTRYLLPVFLVLVSRFEMYTQPTFSANKIQTTDISLRITALSARNNTIILISYCMLALSALLFWLVFRLVIDTLFKVVVSISTKKLQVKKVLDKRIEANYRKCLRDVCADFIEYCIENSNSLDILCRHWAPEPKPSQDSQMIDMPSWILPITGHAFGGPQQSTKGRINGDSFVGGFDGRSPYTASKNLPPQKRFGRTVISHDSSVKDVKREPGGYTKLAPQEKRELPPRFDGVLWVKGIQLGVIEQTAPMVGGLITSMALNLCGWSKKNKVADLDQVWRILVANRGPNGTNPPNWYRRACKACLDWYDKEPEDHFNINNLLNLRHTPVAKIEFLQRVQQVTWNRNIIRTRGVTDGPLPYIGIAPSASQKSDIVCIVLGCSVPVVLQPQLNGEFKFVGECYVHDVMDGEAVDPIPSWTREQWFKLV